MNNEVMPNRFAEEFVSNKARILEMQYSMEKRPEIQKNRVAKLCER